jgi:putative thioredoxin
MNATDFQTDVIEASRERPVLVDFWAPWCGPCRMLGPVLEKLAGENEGKWRLVKVNTDENPAVASRYSISSIPAVKLFVDGEVKDEFIGALPEPRVKQWLEAALPSRARGLIEEAAAVLDAGDMARALELTEAALAEDPGNPDARLLLARLLLFTEPGRAETLAREAAAARPSLYTISSAVETLAELVESKDQLAGLPEGKGRQKYARAVEELAAGRLDEAAAGFIDSLRVDRAYEEEAARKALVALFNLLGDRHAVTQKYRRAFQMAVF